MDVDEIVNTTPHDITLVMSSWNDPYEVTLPAAEKPARVEMTREKSKEIALWQHCAWGQSNVFQGSVPEGAWMTTIPVNKVSCGKVYNLPSPREGTIYIVSRTVAENAKGRNDLYIVDETIRDDKGRIIGAKSLAQI